jgi:serine protein kinase
LQKQIENESLSKEQEERYKNFIKEVLMPKYAENLQEDLQKAFLESYHDLGQNIFDQYIVYADNWIEHKDFRDPHTGNLFDREILNKELEMIEKAAGIANPKDFRHETVNYVLRFKANHGRNPDWTSYEKLRLVIEKKMFANTEELLPVISYSKKATSEEEKKHHGFVERMMKQGYTEKMVRIAVEWYVRYKKHA